MQPVITVNNISKKYRLGAVDPYALIKESLVNSLPFIKTPNPLTLKKNEFWAVNNVSFKVNEGEVVGIIGANGAGKSTLLKILSRITIPTSGTAHINGRVVSMLEVGTGFNGDLTGRENIFLNGAILGMQRREVQAKYDSIIDFAGIEKFIDTPVKYYSSGMYMRLAFSVASHLQSEILILDEVLAVGDANFQKKSLGAMSSAAKQGKTVLFVSHNLAAIESLTSRCLVMSEGKLVFDGDKTKAITYYLKRTKGDQGAEIGDWKDRKGGGEAKVLKFAIETPKGKRLDYVRPGEPFKVRLKIKFNEPVVANVAVIFETETEKPLFTTHLSDSKELTKQKGTKEFSVTIDRNHLRQGQYLVSVVVFTPDIRHYYDAVYHYPAFEVQGNNSEIVFPIDKRWGELYFPFSWDEA